MSRPSKSRRRTARRCFDVISLLAHARMVATAVEFSLIALPFLSLLAVILQTSLHGLGVAQS